MVYPFFELNCVSLQTRLFGGPSSLKTSTTINLITAVKATTLQRVFVINMYKQLIVLGHKYVLWRTLLVQSCNVSPPPRVFSILYPFCSKMFPRLFVTKKSLKSENVLYHTFPSPNHVPVGYDTKTFLVFLRDQENSSS